MTENLKIGDTVKLKSGGPKMTVIELDIPVGGKRHVRCTWFTKNDIQEQGTFPQEALERAN